MAEWVGSTEHVLNVIRTPGNVVGSHPRRSTPLRHVSLKGIFFEVLNKVPVAASIRFERIVIISMSFMIFSLSLSKLKIQVF